MPREPPNLQVVLVLLVLLKLFPAFNKAHSLAPKIYLLLQEVQAQALPASAQVLEAQVQARALPASRRRLVSPWVTY